MDLNTQRLLMGAAGAAGGLGIEEIFSTWLYTGNGSTQTITNGIDLSGEGGLTWIKKRAGTASTHVLFDTARGASTGTSSSQNKALSTALTSAEGIGSGLAGVSAFNSNGFTLDGTQLSPYPANGPSSETYVSWTFRKAPGFFDVVTYTGNGSTQTIAHSLGSTPGCIIIKRTDSTSQWFVYHRSADPNKNLWLDSTSAEFNNGGPAFSSITSTSIVIDRTYVSSLNNSGATYVAYLFAHDEQIFGETGDQSVIKCGVTSSLSAYTTTRIELGWEPQWILAKPVNASGNWILADSMRGIAIDFGSAAGTPQLFPNLSNAEATGSHCYTIDSTGFSLQELTGSTTAYIYIAIRRGPMKTPTSGTEVFNPYVTASITPTGSTSMATTYDVGFTPDFVWQNSKDFTDGWYVGARLTGNRYMKFETTAAEVNGGVWDSNVGAFSYNAAYGTYNFRRAPGFFDVVAYTGQSSTPNHNVKHNLGVTPELIIFKRRNSAKDWWVYSAPIGTGKVLYLNTNLAVSNDASFIATTPTSTEITTNSYAQIDNQGDTYIAYLFATLPGISKVGSYTGTATTQQIDCGFTSGARFVLIKRTDSTGDWYVWDTARGIVSGNDPYLLLNSTAAEVTSTDYIDPYSAGFEISSTAPAAINASGGSFIFLAIA